LQQAEVVGFGCGFAARPTGELCEDVPDVHVDRAWAEVELTGYFAVRSADGGREIIAPGGERPYEHR
jgi:hypothetical protein